MISSCYSSLLVRYNITIAHITGMFAGIVAIYPRGTHTHTRTRAPANI